MSWLLTRTLVAVLAALAGALLGAAVGGTVGAIVGATAPVALLVVLDGLRGARLMRWLRGAQQSAAPRDAGFWGELGYRVERALRLREAGAELERNRLVQFLSAIEASPNGVLLLDAGDQIDWMNTVAADHFGLDPRRDRRQRVTNLLRAPAFVAHLQRGDYGEPVLVADAARDRAVQVLVRPYGDGAKLVLSQDVTERNRSDAMRRDFVANVSHEIRTPLTVLAGFVETMSDLPLDAGERRRVLTLMAQQTGRMQALVADLLTLAQIEGSPRPAADQWLALAPLLRRAEADGAALAGGRLTLDMSGAVDAEAAEIAGNETELLSAVGNLVGNAVRYTPDGGRVAIRFDRRADGGADITVEDSGVGIAREHLGRLTERFYRVDTSRSRDTGGTGLGLAIVKHVVQRHGGEIAIDSEPGRGSRFTLRLPAARVRQRATVAA